MRWTMAKGDDLEERLIEFAVRIVKLGNAMPKPQPVGIWEISLCVAEHHLLSTMMRPELRKVNGTLSTKCGSCLRNWMSHISISRSSSAVIYCQKKGWAALWMNVTNSAVFSTPVSKPPLAKLNHSPFTIHHSPFTIYHYRQFFVDVWPLRP